MLNLLKILIHSNIFISLAAVSLTIATQIQLGMAPQWHPYLFIIFFATLFEYNIHRLITVIKNKDALDTEKHGWVKNNLYKFYLLVFLSVAGFLSVAFLAKKEVLIALAPIAVLTILYSLPFFEGEKIIFRLRDIPFLKIFLIAFVWSVSTILLPVIQSGISFKKIDIVTMLLERFLFIFAITIPFDIRDMKDDRQAGLKTIPLVLGEKAALIIAYIALFSFFVISFIHYWQSQSWFIVYALSLSTITTFYFLKSKKIRALRFYHYGILDGTMLLQGLLVLFFYYGKIYFNF